MGDVFENWITESFEYFNIHCKRIKTRLTAYEGDNEIADFYCFNKSALIYLEAKSTKSTSFPFSMIKLNQLKGLYEVDTNYKNVYGGFLVDMRRYNEVYYVPIQLVEQVLKTKKSISIKQLREDAIEVVSKDGYLDIRNLEEEVIQWNKRQHKK